MDTPTILVVERDGTHNCSVTALLKAGSWNIIVNTWSRNVPQILHREGADLIIVASPQNNTRRGLELVQHIRESNKHIPIILIAADSSEDQVIEALRLGVFDYFKSPVSPEALVDSVKRWFGNTPFSSVHHNDPREELTDGKRLVGKSPAMQIIACAIHKIAKSESNVLVTGETGTGKELVAQLLHKNSTRRHQRFVCINCAAIPDSLLESELFGYRKGAFTGAQVGYEGKIKYADAGTIFLDEIGDMSLYSQGKILRVVETKEMQCLGGVENVPIDVRVIAATNQSLESLVLQGRFRKDLFFRLNIARLHVPPLRERKEDISLLCEHFIQELNSRFGLSVCGCTEGVLERLLHYPWPGNVRELRNILEVAFINCPVQWIQLADLPEPFRRPAAEEASPCSIQDSERNRVLAALSSTNWNKSKAAQKLKWSRMTLYRRMGKYHIKGGEPAWPVYYQG